MGEQVFSAINQRTLPALSLEGLSMVQAPCSQTSKRIFPTFAARSAPHQNALAFNPAAPITINCEFMDQNAPATPHDAPPQLAKHISIGNSDGVGSIFSQLASNPFFTAVGRAALLFLEASSELNISTTIGIWLSRPCSCCARRPEKPQTGRRPASTSHAC